MRDSVKVLLDTDIGSDIDDAVCLAYLLTQPRCELLGITTATGEAEERARLASALCMHAGKGVPIFPGAHEPLLLTQRQRSAPQASALGRWPHRTDFLRGEAVEFLRHTIRSNPGEVILLTIGPLTNIGLLFAADPDIPSSLRGLVMMCGHFLDPPAKGWGPFEWNAVLDAHAMTIVYKAPVATHRSIGLDVTSQVHMSGEQFRSTFGSIPIFSPIMDWAEVWFRDQRGTAFHDPLAAATIFEPAICHYRSGTVNMNLDEGERFGLTRWDSGGGGPGRSMRLPSA
jgi:inosine-uridine nucleoside N-ribohydrolase